MLENSVLVLSTFYGKGIIGVQPLKNSFVFSAFFGGMGAIRMKRPS
jgi:hypothetical protein